MLCINAKWSLKRKRKIGQHSAMDSTHLICLHAVHGRVPWGLLGRKKKNWAALCHGRHAFRLCMPFMAECHEEFWEGKRKIGQHSAMDSTHLICLHAVHGRVPWGLLGRKKKNWAALCHGWHAFRLCMPFMAECHEEFWEGKRKIGQHSTMDGMHLDCACHSWQSAMKSLWK